MWSKSKLTLIGAAALTVALLLPVASPMAGNGEIKITEDRQKACAKAEKRFNKIFPDYKPEPGVVIVKLHKYNFCPANLTVKAGTTVRWINVDRRTSHSVWLKQAGLAESDRLFPEEIWQHTFNESGAYPYLCGPHWEGEDMRGHVIVQK